ncbi:TIGR04282 family arsenosugar biosynthesis glycosyltransferase [Magnetovibrio sp.]|uniref:TIGR04282 family arsenosugar biosynthesis glycosyltransferase n=1 Tax=Magnetovibrio sp. TaxID=2024836 RepID=UPI002F94F18D
MRHLVLMAKAPRIGRVKSRLAKDIGQVGAWAFQRRTLFDVARKLKDDRWRCWLSVTPDRSRFEPRMWPKGWTLISQGDGDLGDRMLRPWLDLPPGPVVIVGSDIPDITATHIAAAFEALGENDLVFGPATDGGYWLVGAKRRPCPINPFAGVRWSSEHALNDTIANVPVGAKIGFIETLSDVDDEADLKRGAL